MSADNLIDRCETLEAALGHGLAKLAEAGDRG